MTDKINVVWNSAVRKVGSQRLSLASFLEICKAFKEVARSKGITEEEIEQQIQENYEATHTYFSLFGG